MKKTLLTLLTSAALFSFAATMQADNLSNHGITASPKYRDMIQTQSIAPAAVSTRAMTCPMCKDESVTRKDMTVRGANKPTITVTTHTCNGCSTRLTVVGHGKMAETVARHTCTMSQAPACCATGS